MEARQRTQDCAGFFEGATRDLIPDAQMSQILEEQDFQLTGCTTNECAVEIGQLIGAQHMLDGSIGKFGTVYTIDMKIIDVDTILLHDLSGFVIVL